MRSCKDQTIFVHLHFFLLLKTTLVSRNDLHDNIGQASSNINPYWTNAFSLPYNPRLIDTSVLPCADISFIPSARRMRIDDVRYMRNTITKQSVPATLIHSHIVDFDLNSEWALSYILTISAALLRHLVLSVDGRSSSLLNRYFLVVALLCEITTLEIPADDEIGTD